MATYKNHSFEIEINKEFEGCEFSIIYFTPSNKKIEEMKGNSTTSPKLVGDQAFAYIETKKPMVGAELTKIGVVTWIRPKVKLAKITPPEGCYE